MDFGAPVSRIYFWKLFYVILTHFWNNWDIIDQVNKKYFILWYYRRRWRDFRRIIWRMFNFLCVFFGGKFCAEFLTGVVYSSEWKFCNNRVFFTMIFLINSLIIMVWKDLPVCVFTILKMACFINHVNSLISLEMPSTLHLKRWHSFWGLLQTMLVRHGTIE